MITRPKNLPSRTEQPRENGLTMVMDSGLSLDQLAQCLEVGSDHIDVVKLGFGTSLFTKGILEKTRLLREMDMPYFVGGTLFEAFLVRNDISGYLKLAEELQLPYVEVSDGSMELDHDKKCEYIADFVKRGFRVMSEVGSKDGEEQLPDELWVQYLEKELEAGSWKVITESREGGNVGIYSSEGEAKSDLISSILEKVAVEKILWEAPKKSQQVWFIKKFGANVNLGNIAPNAIIALEALRMGLRGDTFHQYL